MSEVNLENEAGSYLRRTTITLASISYLTRDGSDGEDHVAGDFAHVADLEASSGPVPNQDVGEDELVLVCDEHALVLHGLQDLAEVGVAADAVFLKDGPYVVSHKRCEKKGGRAEMEKASCWV